MAVFGYQAIGQNGDRESGILEALDRAAAIEQLQGRSLMPVELIETSAGGRRGPVSSGAVRPGPRGSIFDRRRISSDDIAGMTRELSTLLRSGLTLDRALDVLRGLADDGPLRVLLGRLQDQVRGGAAFSKSLENDSAIFGRFFISMVRAGEAGGALGDVLLRISEHLERSKDLRETVKSALIYPTILVVVATLSVMMLLIFVVPQFSQMFQESGKALPLPTQIVIGAGEFLRSYWWTLVVVAIVLLQYFSWQMSDPKRRYPWDRLLLRLPLVGELVGKVEIARFSRTLSTLLQNGVPLLGALAIVTDTVDNTVIARGLASVQDQVKEGKGFSQPLADAGIFPKLATHMVMVGEETGHLDEMLIRVADTFDREVQSAVKRMLALLEPIMILGLGLLIGGIIMSILLAILSINSLVG
jgi:general secretion pathway protein F